MNIISFNHNHMNDALKIAINNYDEERKEVPILPQITSLPDLTHFAENGLGVAAFEGDLMLGFLGAYIPREDAFGSTNVRGTFSPIHAHGVLSALPFDRDRIYSLMYQAAADKWVKEGIKSHAIALYTHDKEAVNSFFYNGFGMRCIDAIRSLEDVLTPVNTSKLCNTTLEYCEVPVNEHSLLLECNNALIRHLGNSPTFMHFELIDEAEFYRWNSEDTRYFAVKDKGTYIAYIKIADTGENFATEVSGMANICGAYCDPAYRGEGIYHNLLAFLMNVLKKEGYHLLGVDFESFNPTARGFWLKYFTEYTHSVVRRIDDKVFNV